MSARVQQQRSAVSISETVLIGSTVCLRAVPATRRIEFPASRCATGLEGGHTQQHFLTREWDDSVENRRRALSYDQTGCRQLAYTLGHDASGLMRQITDWSSDVLFYYCISWQGRPFSSFRCKTPVNAAVDYSLQTGREAQRSILVILGISVSHCPYSGSFVTHCLLLQCR